MARTNLEGARINDCILHAGNRFGVMIAGTTTTFTMGPDMPHMLVLTPTNATNLLLPASPALGDHYILVNTAAFVITLQTSAGAALSPAMTFTQNEIAQVVYCGATHGWKAFVGVV